MIPARFVSWLGSLSSFNAKQARRRETVDRPSGQMEVLEERQLMTTDLDDQIREAVNLGAANRQLTRNDSMANTTDVDMVRFAVTAGQQLAFDIDLRSGSRLDSVVRLFNSSGRQLALNDDSAAPGEPGSLESYLEYRFMTAGTYYLGISGYGNMGYNAVTGANDRPGSRGSYSLTVTEVDPDDQMAEAHVFGALTQSGEIEGTISNPLDVDLGQFAVAAGQTVSFDIDRPSGNLDSMIRLFDVHGTRIASNDNGAAPGEAGSRDSFLRYTFTTAGTYYLGISGAGNAAYNAVTGAGDHRGSQGAYRLVMTTSEVVTDDSYEENDTMGTAANLGAISGTLTVSNLQLRDTADWFRFTIDSEGTSDSRVRMSLTHSDGDLDMALYNASGQMVGDSDSVSDLESISLNGLPAGEYFVQVYGYNGARNSYTLAVAPPLAPVPTDGFQNSHIAQLVNQAYVDQNLDRQEMIGILRSGGNDGVVDGSELADFRYIVSASSPFTMPAYVRGLASDVVNSNPANLRSQGAAAGNLEPGSSSALLNTLINEWFLGTDLPAVSNTSFSYRASTGRLFNGTPSLADMRQGMVGDCYFIAALGSLADRNPDAVRNMFVDNGDGTYTVRFYSPGGVADYVTVNRSLPVSADGTLVYSGMGQSVSSLSTTLWIALAEKAYAQWNESGNAGRDGSNSYEAISGGWMGSVNQQVLGYSSTDQMVSNSTRTALIAALSAQQAVTIGTHSTSTLLVGQHAYVVSSYNAATQRFTLVNPWGSHQPGPLTWADLQRDCSWFVTTSPAGPGGFSGSVGQSVGSVGTQTETSGIGFATLTSRLPQRLKTMATSDHNQAAVLSDTDDEKVPQATSGRTRSSSRSAGTPSVTRASFTSRHQHGDPSSLASIDIVFADVATGMSSLL